MNPRTLLIAGTLVAILFLADATADLDADAAISTAPLPRGVHVSYTDDPATTLTAVWFTDGTVDPGTVIEYGTSKKLGLSVSGTSHRAPGVAVLVHEATMTGLTAGSTVHYRVGAPGAWSDVFVSQTMPAEGPLRFILMADHGTNSDAIRTSEQVVLEDADMMLFAGDLSYANGDQPEWDLWFDQIQPWASRIPLMASIGNHEHETGFGPAAFLSRMALPDAEVYWSFDYGRIHVLAIDSYTSSSAPEGYFDDMVAFAEADLKDAAARREAGELDHVFMLQHHPLYSNHEDPNRKIQPDMAALVEEWLHRYGVKVLIVGHNHHYERSYPMAYGAPTTTEQDEYVDPVGWIQHTTGGAGRSLYSFDHPDDFMPWSAAHARRHHYTTLEIDGGSLHFTAVSSDFHPGEILDEYRLTVTGVGALGLGPL